MVNICLKAAKKVLWEKPKSKIRRCKIKEIVKFSEKQKKIRDQTDSTRNEKVKKKKRATKKLKELIKNEKEKVKENELEEIESKHTDASKCFETDYV